MESSVRGPTSECPTEDDLIAYARQRLVAEVVPGVELHLASCSICNDTVAVFKSRFNTAVAAELPSGDATRVYTTKSLPDDSPSDDGGDLGRDAVEDEVRFDL